MWPEEVVCAEDHSMSVAVWMYFDRMDQLTKTAKMSVQFPVYMEK